MTMTGERVAVVTGAGSGVGRAVAIELARAGWSVGLTGRTEAPLRETAALGGPDRRLVPLRCDLSVEADVLAMARRVREELGDPSLLVNCAGTNVPKRSLRELSVEDYKRVLDANLTGAFLCVHAFLPAMRSRGDGTIVNVVSDAGLTANAKAGAAYVASKFGLAGLTQSINAEERGNGIRACAIFPGDINTPLLDKRLAPPPKEARLQMLQPEDVAACVMLAVSLPSRAIIEQLVIRPR